MDHARIPFKERILVSFAWTHALVPLVLNFISTFASKRGKRELSRPLTASERRAEGPIRDAGIPFVDDMDSLKFASMMPMIMPMALNANGFDAKGLEC